MEPLEKGFQSARGKWKELEGVVRATTQGPMRTSIANLADTVGRVARQLETVAKEMRKTGGEGEQTAKKVLSFREQAEKWTAGMQDFAKKAGIAFAAGAAGISALAAAASPQAFSTVTGSIGLLAQTVGQVFIPHMVEAAAWVQRAVYWFDSLSAATKDSIGYWTVFAVVGAGAVFTFVKIAGAIAVAVKAVTSLSTAVAALNLGLKATPVGIILTLAGAAAALAAGHFAGSAFGGGGRNSLSGKTEKDIIAEMNEVALAKGRLNQGGTAAQFAAEAPRLALTVAYGGRVANAVAGKSLEDLTKDEATLKTQLAQVRGQAPRGKGLLTNYNFRSQYMSAIDAYKAIQTAGLSTSPLEQERLKREQENHRVFQDLAAGKIVLPVRDVKGGGVTS